MVWTTCHPQPQSPWLPILIALLALLLAAVALIPGTNAYSLWLDDILVLEGAQSLHTPADIFRWERTPTSIVNPPLIYIVLRGWTAVAGDSDLALRALSLLFAMLCVASVYRVTKDLTKRIAAGFTAAIIFANFGFFDYYAHMVHSYMLMAAACGLLLLFSLRWWRNQQGLYALGVVVFSPIILYAHYYGVFFVIALNGTLLLGTAWKKPPLIPRWVGLQVLAALLFLPWIPATLDLMGGGYESSTEFATNTSTSSSDEVFLLKKMLRRLFYDGLVFYGVLLAIGVMATWRRRTTERSLRQILLFMAVLIGSILVVALLGNHFYQSFRTRRVIYLLIPSAIILGALLAQLRPTILVGVLAAFLWLTPDQPLTAGIAGNWFFRESVEEVAAHAQPGDVVFLDYNSRADVWPFRYYADRLLLPHIPYYMSGENPITVSHIVWPRERLWVVRRGTDPLLWPEPLDQKQFTEISHTLFGQHQVSLFAATGPDQPVDQSAIANPAELPMPQVFGGLFQLHDYRIDRLSAAPGERVDIWLDWSLAQATDQDWGIFVHLVDDDLTLLGQADNSPSHLGYVLPTYFWPVGLPIFDHYSLTIDPETPPGVYNIRIGVYHRIKPLRLPVVPGDGSRSDDGLIIARVEIK